MQSDRTRAANRHLKRRLACLTLPALLTPLAGLNEASAETLNVLTLGDSLTYGWGYTNDGIGYSQNDVGYRLKLQQLMFEEPRDFDFIGGFGIGGVSPFDPDNQSYNTFVNGFNPVLTNSQGQTKAFDTDHFGWPGAQAGSPSSAADERELILAMLGQSNKEEPATPNPSRPDFPTQWSGSTGIPGQTYTSNRQDVNVYGGLIQQDAGDYHAGPNPGQPWTQAAVDGGTNPNATSDWAQDAPADAVLLHIGTNTVNQTSGSGNAALDQLESLFEQLYSDVNAGKIADDAKIFVAEIVPKGARNTSEDDGDKRTIRQSYIYNQGMAGALLDASVDDDFRDMIVFVDMFDIQITQDLLDSLGLVDDSLLDLDDDGVVDWWDGTYDPATNSGDFDKTTNFASGMNENLWGDEDFVHLAPLGYELMAYQWFAAMDAEGLLIPEPSSLALLAIGGGLIMGRRRRA